MNRSEILFDNYIKNKKHTNYFILLCGMCVLVFIRTVLAINIPISIFLIYSVIMSIFINKEEQIAFMATMIPFSSSFQYRYVLGICLFFLIFKEKKRIKVTRLIPVFLLMIWELLHANTSNLTVYGYLQEFIELIVVSYMLSKSPNNYEDGLPFRSLAYVSVFSGIMNWVVSVKKFGFSLSSMSRLGKVGIETAADFETFMDPNTIAFMCLLSISSLLLLKYHNMEKRTDKYVSLFLFGILILAQSRAAIALTFVLIFFYYVFSGNFRYVKKKSFISGAIGILGILILGIGFFGNTLLGLLARLNSEDMSNGRIAIFLFYHMHLFKNPRNWLFGIGLYKYTSQIMELYGDLWVAFPGVATYSGNEIVYKVSHLGVQEIMVAWGVVGLILFSIIVFLCINHRRGVPKGNYTTIIVLMIFFLQGQIISSGVALLGFLIALLCIDYYPGMKSGITRR